MPDELENLLEKLDCASEKWDTEEVERLSGRIEAVVRESAPEDSGAVLRVLRQRVREAAARYDADATVACAGKLNVFLRETIPGRSCTVAGIIIIPKGGDDGMIVASLCRLN